MMTTLEIAKELTVALISRITIPVGGEGNVQDAPKWVSEAYQTIHQGILEANKQETQ